MIELTLEEIAKAIDDAVEVSPLSVAEEQERKTQLANYESTVSTIAELETAVNTEGASRETALVLESLVEGVLPERYPVASFTQLPSKTNYKVALEAISGGKIAAAAALIAAIIAGIYKLVKWIIQLLRGSKGVADVAVKEAAQARTITETVNQAVNDTQSSKLDLPNFDPNEITKLRKQVFLEQATKELSKATLLLVFEERKFTRDLYSSIYKLLNDSRVDLFTATETAIKTTVAKLRDFIERSKQNKTTTETTLVAYFEQPLRGIVYAFANLGLLEVETEFHGRNYSQIGKILQPVKQTQYISTLVDQIRMVTGPAETKVLDDTEATALLATNSYFNPEFYRSDANLTKLEGAVQWFAENIRIPDDVEAKIGKINEAIGALKKVAEEFEECARTDANALLIQPGIVNHIHSYQQDINVLTRLVYIARSMQREIAMWFRLMATGETACLNYLLALSTDESTKELRDLVAEKRKEHTKTLNRFKAYLKD